MKRWIPLLACSAAIACAQPANDNFGSAAEIAGSAGFVTGDNVGASSEAGEPDHADESGGASVWWRWTAPADGPVTIDTFGSSFDTVLAVYIGEEVRIDEIPFPILELILIASNDDHAGDDTRSCVTFDAAAGTFYRIAVANFDYRERGDIVFNWRMTAAPTEPLRIEGLSQLPNGSFRFVLRGTPGTPGMIQRSNNLAAWDAWIPFTLEAGAMEAIDPEAPTAPARFYRATIS